MQAGASCGCSEKGVSGMCEGSQLPWGPCAHRDEAEVCLDLGRYSCPWVSAGIHTHGY